MNPIIFPSKFESTLSSLDLEIAQFPNVTNNNIQMKNICPNEAGSMNTKFLKQEKTLKYEMHYNNPKTIQFSQNNNFYKPI